MVKLLCGPPQTAAEGLGKTLLSTTNAAKGLRKTLWSTTNRCQGSREDFVVTTNRCQGSREDFVVHHKAFFISSPPAPRVFCQRRGEGDGYYQLFALYVAMRFATFSLRLL